MLCLQYKCCLYKINLTLFYNVHESAFTRFKTFNALWLQKDSTTSFSKSRRNFKICKAQLPDEKRYYWCTYSLCLLIMQKTKIVKRLGFSGILCMLALLFILLLCQAYLYFALKLPLWYFCLPANLMFYSLNRFPFVLPYFFAYSSSDIGGLFSSYYFYWWMTGWILRILLKNFQCFAFLLCAFSYLHSFNFTQLLPQTFQICSAETHHFCFYPFAFTLVPITNLTRFWFLFTSGSPHFSHSLSLFWYANPSLWISFTFSLQGVYLLCYKKAFYYVLGTLLGIPIY